MCNLTAENMTDSDVQQTQLIISAIADLKHQPGALLPILHKIQQLLGYIPKSSIQLIASELNLSQADVFGVISFYHDFRISKPGKYIIQLCRAESCQAMGSKKLHDYIKQKLAIDFHQTSTDGLFSLQDVYCLGNCAASPAIRIGNTVYGDMTADKFDQLLDKLSKTADKVDEL